MHFSSAIFGLAAITAVSAATSDWTIPVAVGPDGLLEYAPNNIFAPVGAKIRFIFNPKNHTVTQSSFNDPCHPLEGGFFSGFVPTAVSPSSTTFTIEVKDEKPIWFYCGQTTGNHCQAGMVGAINAPATGEKTLQAFIQLAAKADASTSPEGGAVGGVLSTNNATLSYSSAITSAAATAWQVSTYTTNGQTVTTSIATSTVFETILVAATQAPALSSPSGDGSSNPSSTSSSSAGAAEVTAHMLGVAAIGLGALAFL